MFTFLYDSEGWTISFQMKKKRKIKKNKRKKKQKILATEDEHPEMHFEKITDHVTKQSCK